MPKTEDGKPLDLIFSPLAIPSRKNLGQLYEVNAGLIAERTGKAFKSVNFSDESEKEIEKGLKDIGVEDGKLTLIDPESSSQTAAIASKTSSTTATSSATLTSPSTSSSPNGSACSSKPSKPCANTAMTSPSPPCQATMAKYATP